MHRKTLPTLLAAALCLGLFASPALAQLSVSVTISDAPPEPRHEVVHPARRGYVWVPGTWYWEGGRHRWADGYWLKARPGQRWEPARWERRGEYYRFVSGGWAPEHQQPRHEVRYEDHRDNRYDDRYDNRDNRYDDKHSGKHDQGRGNGKGPGHPGDKGWDHDGR